MGLCLRAWQIAACNRQKEILGVVDGRELVSTFWTTEWGMDAFCTGLIMQLSVQFQRSQWSSVILTYERTKQYAEAAMRVASVISWDVDIGLRLMGMEPEESWWWVHLA